MKFSRFSFCLVILFLLCGIGAAQPYSVRVTYNTNLRASHSLHSRVVATVPAGTTLQVIGRLNRWLNISRNGNVWMADWVPHTRVNSGAASSDINNCCFVDWQCDSDREWVSGYWAFHRNECPAGPSATQETAVQPVNESTAESNNCCFTGWQCHNNDDWVRGYWAFQNNQCSAPPEVDNCCFTGWQCNSDAEWATGYLAYQFGRCDSSQDSSASQDSSSPANSSARNGNIRIEGSRSFRVSVNAGLDLLKTRAPRWYDYVQGATRTLKELPYGAGAGVDVESRTHATAWGVDWVPSDLNIYTIAHEMVHEACHIYQFQTGDPDWYSPAWRAGKGVRRERTYDVASH